jgi:hypothetical protein
MRDGEPISGPLTSLPAAQALSLRIGIVRLIA